MITNWTLLGFDRSTDYLEDVVEVGHITDQNVLLLTGLPTEMAVDSYPANLPMVKLVLGIELNPKLDWFLEQSVEQLNN